MYPDKTVIFLQSYAFLSKQSSLYSLMSPYLTVIIIHSDVSLKKPVIIIQFFVIITQSYVSL